jgi:hypothetical protein
VNNLIELDTNNIICEKCSTPQSSAYKFCFNCGNTLQDSGDLELIAAEGEYNVIITMVGIIGFTAIIVGILLQLMGFPYYYIATGLGIAVFPAAVVTYVFRRYTFRQIRLEVVKTISRVILKQMRDFSKEAKTEIEKDAREQIDLIANAVKAELGLIQHQTELTLVEIIGFGELMKAGIIRAYPNRLDALNDFVSSIEDKSNKVMVVGSSLKGLLQEDDFSDIAEKLRQRIGDGNVKIATSHPAIVGFRSRTDHRGPEELIDDVIESLTILKEWNFPLNDLRLYKGAPPTCFAIKAGGQILLNPYSYKGLGFNAPCLILKHHGPESYFFNEFNESLFGIWNRDDLMEKIQDYNIIKYFTDNKKSYCNLVEQFKELTA